MKSPLDHSSGRPGVATADGWCTAESRSGLLVTFTLLVLTFRYLPGINDELVPVCRIDSDGEPHGLPVAVKGSPEYFIHGHSAVRRELEEVRFCGVRRAHRYTVAIADLLDVQGFGQVPNSSLLDVASAPEPLRSTIRELHRVVRGLHRPWHAVDEALLMSADDLAIHSYPQPGRDLFAGRLHLDLDCADGRHPVPFAHF